MARRTRRQRTRPDRLADLVSSGLLLVGLAIALAGFSRILDGIGWWWQAVAVLTIVLASAAGARLLVRHPAWGSLAGAVVGVAAIVAMFAPDEALLWFIPTRSTFDALWAIQQAGLTSIAEQDVPAQADPGIVFLVCVGVVGVAALADLFAIGLRAPAFAALPLGVLVLVPSLVRPEFSDAIVFVLVATVFAVLLLLRARRTGWRGTAGIAGAAIVAALAAPVLLPPVIPGEGTAGPSGLTTGLNPIITLGDDLRRGEPTLAMRYTTSAASGDYLRLTVLDEFSGVSWGPSDTDPDPANQLGEFPAPQGLTDAVPRTAVTTRIEVANVLSRWLPLPYAASSVEGLDDSWAWEPAGLTARSATANARDKVYTVESLLVQPSIEQLQAAGTAVEPGFDRYLELPEDLPGVVGQTALAVTAGTQTNYERAVALQSYFTGGLFQYSEEAPVEEGYDGSGASVLGPFLERRSGYCVHFASAMAAMTRSLGIPTRIAVGFTQGDLTMRDGVATWEVTTNDMHAWPELYFVGIGWVRFEPTPGRGEPPAFAQSTQDDPSTPGVDESVPTPAPGSTGAAPTPSSAPALPDEPTPDPAAVGGGGGAGPSASAFAGPAIAIGAALILLIPAFVRGARRAGRLRAVDAGSATAAWRELRDTVVDVGWPADAALTPRRFADDVGELLDDEGRRLLERLRGELERELFADRAAAPSSDDLAGVIRSIRRAAGIGRSALGTVAPRSLLPEGWLAPSPSERTVRAADGTR